MSHRIRKTLTLALGAAFLTGAMSSLQAQNGPPPLPTDPGAPAPPSSPTGPTAPAGPTGPSIPAGPPISGDLGPGIPPPPPPPTEGPAPMAPTAPPAPVVPGLPLPGLAAPNLPPTPADNTSPTPTPDTTPIAPKSVTLRYKFVPGQTVRYKVTTDVDGTTQLGAAGTATPVKLHLETDLHQTVKSVRASDGAATLAVQLDTMTMTINGQTIPVPAQQQRQMRQPSTLVMLPSGKVLSYQAPASGMGSPGVPGLGTNPSEMQNARALPDKAVGEGDTWRSAFASDVLGAATYALYTLTGLSSDGATATIGQKLYTEFKPAKPGTTGAGKTPKINGLMTGTGTEQFDIAAGQVAAQTADLQLKATTTVTVPTPTVVKTQFHITTDMERVTGTPTTTGPARPAPSDEPPTGQLQ